MLGEVEAFWRDGDTGLWIGCDEVGRGPLAGPVTAAAVVFGEDFQGIEGLDDSKKLKASKRESLVEVIKSQSLAYRIVDVGVDVIDRINILQASLQAMREAVEGVCSDLGDVVIRGVWVDGNQKIPGLSLSQWCYVKGDARSYHIAAASVLAKVHRDALMCKLGEVYPGYGFERHYGYGTKAHREAIIKLGRCDVHRKSFHVSGLDQGSLFSCD